MENTKEKFKDFFTGKNISNFQEKRIIVYLIIFAILLMYFSIFFIHNIVDREMLKDTKSPTIIDPGNNNNNNNNNNNGNNNQNYNGGNGGNNPVVDNTDRFRILEGAKAWSELKELSIFSNGYSAYVVDGKIAPGVSGNYNFTVENYCSFKMKYDINFTEENPYAVNMKFKIKLNGNYVAGNESTWVSYAEISQSNRVVDSNAKDLYTIEWKWIDAPNDTEVGETDGAYYKLHVKAYAEEVK